MPGSGDRPADSGSWIAAPRLPPMVMVGQHKRLAEPMSRRQKRGLAVSLAVVVLAVLGATVFAIASHDSFGTSRNGCVSLTVASSLGGTELHRCGASARALCEAAQTENDALSHELRPQCVLAGYGPQRPTG